MLRSVIFCLLLFFPRLPHFRPVPSLGFQIVLNGSQKISHSLQRLSMNIFEALDLRFEILRFEAANLLLEVSKSKFWCSKLLESVIS